MTLPSTDRLIRRAFIYLFCNERTIVLRKKLGTVAGRKVVSEETKRVRYLNDENLLGTLFLLIVGIDLMAQNLLGGAIFTCLLGGEPLFCEVSSAPKP